MANVLKQATSLAMNAAILAKEQIVAPSLISGSAEGQFAQKVGQTVKVKTPPIFSGRRHEGTGSYTADDITETETDIPIIAEAYHRVSLEGRQMDMELTEFTEIVLAPAVTAVAEEVNTICIEQLAKGFAVNLSGTAGGRPTTYTDLIDAHTTLFDQKAPQGGRNAIIDSTALGSLLGLSQFQNLDFGTDRAIGVSRGVLARTHNVTYWPTQAASTIDIGDTGGTVLTNGAPVLGASTISLDGFTVTGGTVKRGARFTVGGASQIYTVTADITLAAGAGDIPVTPVVDAATVAEGDNTAVTFESALHHNMIFHPAAAVKAIIPPMPLRGLVSESATESGVGMNVTFESTIDGTNGRKTDMLVGTYVACEVIRSWAGVMVGG